MFKEFNSKFSILAEEMTNRFTSAGFLTGDIVKIRSDWSKNDKLKGRPSQFIDKIKELIASSYPLRVGCVKSERTESSYETGLTPTAFWVDVAQMINPAFWSNPITLPLEVLELVDNGANLPATSPDQHYDNKEQIKPVAIVIDDADLEKHTMGKDKNRNIGTKNTKLDTVGKSAKDGRDQAKKPVKKESFDYQSENEVLGEAYNLVHKAKAPAAQTDKALSKFEDESHLMSEAYNQVKHDQYE